jgi:hypothetical protein
MFNYIYIYEGLRAWITLGLCEGWLKLKLQEVSYLRNCPIPGNSDAPLAGVVGVSNRVLMCLKNILNQCMITVVV